MQARKAKAKKPEVEEKIVLKIQAGFLVPIYYFLYLSKWILLTILGFTIPYKYSELLNLPYRKQAPRWLKELFNFTVEPTSEEFLNLYILVPLGIYFVFGFFRRFYFSKRVIQKITIYEDSFEYLRGKKTFKISFNDVKDVKENSKTSKKGEVAFKGFTFMTPIKTLFGLQPTKIFLTKDINRLEALLEKLNAYNSSFMPEEKYKSLRSAIIQSDNSFAKKLGQEMPLRNIANSLFFVGTVVLCFVCVIVQAKQFHIFRPQYLLRNSALIFGFLYIAFDFFENSYMSKSVKRELEKRINNDDQQVVREMKFEHMIYIKRFPAILAVWALPILIVWVFSLNTYVLDFSFGSSLSVYLLDSKVQCSECEYPIEAGDKLLTLDKNIAMAQKVPMRNIAKESNGESKTRIKFINQSDQNKVIEDSRKILGKIIYSYSF